MEHSFLTKVFCIAASFLLIASVPAANDPPTRDPSAAQIDTGQQYFNDGQFADALDAWESALDEYRLRKDKHGQARVLMYKAEAYLSMGQGYKAITSLKSALALAEESGDKRLAAQVAGSLGTAYLLANRVDEARALLETAVAAERADGHPGSAAVTGNNLGSLLASQGESDDAITVFQQAISDAKAAGNEALAAKGKVNIARVLVESQRDKEALAELDRVSREAKALPASHDKAYVLISIGRLYSRLAEIPGVENDKLEQLAYQTLNEAADVARSVDDDRGMSYAYGYLGALYEQEGRTEDAMKYTYMALQRLQEIQAPEVRYRWEWQEARLLRAKGNADAAISAYQRAISDLQSIRPELVAGYMGRRGDFREDTGQLYLGLADLLLKRAATHAGTPAGEADLREVRATVELFKGAELADYFQDDCVAALKAKTTGIDSLGERTAAIYPIILPDRLEILLSLPDGMKRYSVPVGAAEMNEGINSFRALLEKRTTNQYRRDAMKIHAWLIQPLEKDLQAQNIDTLVFVPDGALRTIPLAALYDGKDFLIARYAVATIPGLTLTDARPLPRENIQLLAAGLTDSVQGFPPLPNVGPEIEQIHALYDGMVLENNSFTLSNFQKDLGERPYSIVHVASHGKFQKDASDTFLLTYDGKLSMDTLQGNIASTTYRDQPVELLTLSACQTAVGDDKAALGLGGVAVKAGARSALATLWYINDQASSILITDFYGDLKEPGISKAKALQQAQLKLLEDHRYDHPSYWSPFLLIGNWL
jgi:CHAT domain-containing protein/Tfp pilus assembly protein PilF